MVIDKGTQTTTQVIMESLPDINRLMPRIYIVETEANILKYEALCILPHKFSPVMSKANVLDEVVMVLRALRLVDDLELKPLAFGETFRDQQTRMLKLFEVFDSKDAEIIKEFLTALCNLNRLPKVSRDFRKKIRECFPGSVKKIPIQTLRRVQKEINRKRARGQMDSVDRENSKIKRSRSSSSLESIESTSSSLSDLVQIDEVTRRILAEYVRNHADTANSNLIADEIENAESVRLLTDSGISVNSNENFTSNLQGQSTQMDVEAQNIPKGGRFWQIRFKKVACYSLCVLGMIGAGGVYLYKLYIQRRNEFDGSLHQNTTENPDTSAATFLSTVIPTFKRILDNGNIRYTYGRRS